MYIHGSFNSQRGDTVAVHIVTKNDRTDTLEIGARGSGMYFTDDPVETASEANGTFDHLLRQSASIRLLCAGYVADFFCPSCRDAVVNIYQGSRCVFAGFIEPMTFSQPYNEAYDEVELNCIDCLSALQYSKYKDVGALGVLYSVVKAEAKQRTFLDIISEMLGGVAAGLDIAGGNAPRFHYDGSRAVAKGAAGSIFSGLAISELLFLGDEEDDVWQQDEALEEILRYLNLHIVQDGLDFYLFDWETLCSSEPIAWQSLDGTAEAAMQRRTVEITTALAADCGTKISVGEVFNRLVLTCDIQSVEDAVESPLEDSLLDSPYKQGKQLYMTEYSSDGEGQTAYKAFQAIVQGTATEYGGATITHWYVQVMRNSKWRFPMNGAEGSDLVDYFCSSGKNQQDLPNWLSRNMGAAILSFGKARINKAADDNSPVSKVDMENALFVAVNGNGNDDQQKAYPAEGDILNHAPCAVYEGNAAGASFSPADDKSTNYILLSGSVVLNPIMGMTDHYKILHDTPQWTNLPVPEGTLGMGNWWHKTVPSRTNGDGRYYTRQYWKAANPHDDPQWDEAASDGLVPYTADGPEQYEFQYSAVGDGTDKISKVSVLACMLVIGGKCAVEKTPGDDLGTGVPYTGHGKPEDFVWMPYKERSQCASDEEYYNQSFTVGFDPKKGDKLVGTEFDLQNNKDYTYGIDEDGIAIPIKKADHVSGQVRFMVLGPVNALWNNITRRHRTWFRREKWQQGDIPLMAHVSSIVVKDFQVRAFSDNGLMGEASGDNDVVYMSDTKETYANPKDDITFKISSALTADECAALGVSNSVKMSTPTVAQTGDAAASIYDNIRKVQAKPEQMYVDSYWRECHEPRVGMEQNVADAGGAASRFGHYRHPAMGKEFYVTGISRNLMEGNALLNLKETWQ